VDPHRDWSRKTCFTYFDSDDNNSKFEGFSEQESDVDIPNILESSDNEGENESNDEEITDEVELSTNLQRRSQIGLTCVKTEFPSPDCLILHFE
jgi:hypothetical protein